MSWLAMYIEQGSILRTLSHYFSIHGTACRTAQSLLSSAPPVTQLCGSRTSFGSIAQIAKRYQLSTCLRPRGPEPFPSAQTTRSVSCEQNICCERACKGTECARDRSLPSIITEFVEANHIYNITFGEVSIHIVSSMPNFHASTTTHASTCS